MFLKSIEIRGFKSFADKTEILLRDGITAIVGPNGSGKSNISDAIRWVLGEQSVKTLRGGKMEDVIFAGTEFRKPLGLSQVSLILDNSDNKLPIDYNQVTISRRLYRSGESEYYINNTKCRLKDIHELFMDTGIGKEGYSIIGQGKIESLLSGNPEERRGLLEEAAGIVKYKSRKVESEKKLQAAENNIVRINDILATYEERLEPLREESEKAKEFIKLSDSLKKNEVTLITNSLDGYDEKVNLLKKELEEKKIQLDNLLKDKGEKKAKIEEFNKELENLEKEYEEERKVYFDKRENIQEINASIALSNERIKILEESIEKEKLLLEEYAAKEIKYQEEISEEKESLKKAKDAYDKIISELGEVDILNKTRKEDLIEKEKFIFKKKEEREKFLNIAREASSEKLLIDNNLENLKSREESIRASKEGYLNTTRINESTKNHLKEEINSLMNDIEKVNNKLDRNKKRLTNFYKEKTNKEKALRDLQNAITRCEANKTMLTNLENHYEGYNRAVKTIMNDIRNNKVNNFLEDAFVLGEVINVKKEYEVAIETALGFAISNIITDSDAGAKVLIDYLKKHKLGRATFLPLNIIKDKVVTVNDNVKREKGYVGIASELVEVNDKLKKAIDFSLGRTIIAETLESALNIAKITGYSIRIVTLQGEVVNAGGSLTGGATNNKNSNIVGRKREIEELEKQISELKVKIKSSTEEIEEVVGKIKIVDEENLNISDKIHGDKIEITKVNERIASLENENRKLMLSIKSGDNEIIALTKNIKEIEEKKKSLDEKEELVRKESSTLDIEIKVKEEEFIKFKDEIEKAGDKSTVLRIEEAKNKNLIETLEKDIARLEDEKVATSISHIRSKNTIDENTKSILTNKESIKNNNEEIERLNKNIEELNNNFQLKESEKIKLKEKINAINSNIEDNSEILNKQSNEYHKIEIAYTKMNSDYENLISRLNEEYNLTIAEAKEFEKVEGNEEELKKNIFDIKSSINSLGTVNVGSINEYKETLEKYNNMNEERVDLIASKEELIKVIDDMTSTMEEVFKENFKILRKYYDETFKELFKGGHADLVLSGDDILNSPIEINVQPPGKKLQNINLMSGGEKGLSAIALLFAILKMKPTPFCILDEIEAALDDANVNRYADFLRKFSEETQFIVITHRKGTMESSDILYGVTMEEKGVSKIVSVDLRSA